MDKNELITLDAAKALGDVVLTREMIESPEFAASYEQVLALADAIKAVTDKIKENISNIVTATYEEDGTQPISNDKYNFTYVAPTIATSVDSAKLKKDFPDVYKECLKTSSKKASLRVTERKTVED